MNSGTVLTAAHMQRAAYVYVRQSSEFQVRNNVERQRLQYELADHARVLGFHDIRVGTGNVIMGAGLRTGAKASELPPDPNVGAPVPDSTPRL